MKLSIQARNMVVTPGITKRIEKKTETMGKYLRSETEMQIRMRKEKNDRRVVEITVPMGNNVILRIESSAELCEAVGKRLHTHEEIHAAALALIREGARNVLVTMGGDGAMLVNPGGTLTAPGLKVPVSSTVGAGDALTAGFVAGFAETGDFREAMRRGMAAGAASVMTDGTQLIRREDYDRLIDRVEIREG